MLGAGKRHCAFEGFSPRLLSFLLLISSLFVAYIFFIFMCQTLVDGLEPLLFRGWGEFGRLGHGDTESRFFPEPLAQGCLKEVVSASCGAHHTIAVCADGRLATWGWGCEGQLGTGDTSDQLVPVFIRSIPNHKVSRPIIIQKCVPCVFHETRQTKDMNLHLRGVLHDKRLEIQRVWLI
jgi:hypothetical protein